MKFGDEVRRRRKALRLTLEQLAARAGLSPKYVGSIEAGKRERDPSLRVVMELAKGLRVPLGPAAAEVDWPFGWPPPSGPPSSTPPEGGAPAALQPFPHRPRRPPRPPVAWNARRTVR